MNAIPIDTTVGSEDERHEAALWSAAQEQIAVSCRESWRNAGLRRHEFEAPGAKHFIYAAMKYSSEYACAELPLFCQPQELSCILESIRDWISEYSYYHYWDQPVVDKKVKVDVWSRGSGFKDNFRVHNSDSLGYVNRPPSTRPEMVENVMTAIVDRVCPQS